MREFKPGDRVRVYHLQMAFRSDVKDVSHVGHLQVWNDFDSHHMWVSPKQCRRLKPKSKVKKEARRVWLGTDVESGKVGVSTFSYRMQNPGDKEFREVLENEVVVTRETLAKAFKSIGTFRPTPKLIAAALGLEVKP